MILRREHRNNTVSDRTENVGKEERRCRMVDSDESDDLDIFVPEVPQPASRPAAVHMIAASRLRQRSDPGWDNFYMVHDNLDGYPAPTSSELAHNVEVWSSLSSGEEWNTYFASVENDLDVQLERDEARSKYAFFCLSLIHI